MEHAIGIEAGEAQAFVEQPQAAAAIHGHCLDQDLRQIRRTWPESQLAIGFATPDIAARIADPQRALAIQIDRANAVVEQAGLAGAIEHGKLEAVVTDQAFPGAKPQVAFRSLREATDRVVRQALHGGPAVDGVIAQGGRRWRLDRKRAASQQQDRGEDQLE